jgi:hypothetical protein
MAKSSPLRILVIGSTGHGGSYLCIELCNRGHKVTGLARNPEKLGTHANYIPKQLDVVNCSFTELHQGLEGYDVVIKYDTFLSPMPNISEFSPHSEGHAALVYSTRHVGIVSYKNSAVCRNNEENYPRSTRCESSVLYDGWWYGQPLCSRSGPRLRW